jgi:hypothetical protein
MDRRSFLLAMPPVLALPAAGPPLAAIVFDTRHPAARAFAARMGGPGVAAFPSTGDTLKLWYGDLGDRLRRGPARVAGMTSYADLVVARAWGRDHGWRLIVQAQAGPLCRWHLLPR